MTDFNRLDGQELQQTRKKLLARYEEFKSRNIALDMTRGKPCSEQTSFGGPR